MVPSSNSLLSTPPRQYYSNISSISPPLSPFAHPLLEYFEHLPSVIPFRAPDTRIFRASPLRYPLSRTRYSIFRASPLRYPPFSHPLLEYFEHLPPRSTLAYPVTRIFRAAVVPFRAPDTRIFRATPLRYPFRAPDARIFRASPSIAP
jgi:hypothetical protein